MRKKLQEMGLGASPVFRLRGGEISRLEGFSDAVFAFAVTLLVVSLEVPTTFTELMEIMRGFPVFAVCFALLASIWYQHYAFFSKYGIHDGWTSAINFLLLFLVLLYVYPLKFLFTMLWNSITGHVGKGSEAITASQAGQLLIIYGLGFAAVYLLLALLYVRALRLKGTLDLTSTEVVVTKCAVTQHLLMGSVPLASVVLCLSGNPDLFFWAGMVYWVIPILMAIHGSRSGEKVRRAQSATS